MIKWFLVIFPFVFLNTAFGQMPPVGTIDFFGLQKVSEKAVSKKLKIKIGDDAFETLKSVEENRKLLKSLPNVEDASINLVCCDESNGKSIVFVGIREKGTPALSFRAAPTGTVRLPNEIIQAGNEFQKAFMESLKNQDFSEDDSAGHTLYSDKNTRAIQKKFILLAAKNLKILRQVLQKSSDAKQRALAAQIIAYAENKRDIVGDLIFAVDDPESEVRNNAMRALIIISQYAQANPVLNIKIPVNIFIEKLNSLDWTDRNKAVGILETMTAKRDAALLLQLKSQALSSLVEMARWKSSAHAHSAFLLLGRIANFSESEIEFFWKSDKREIQIQKLLNTEGKQLRN